MADDTGESKDDVLVWVWGLLGGIAGIVASAKYAQSAGFAYEEKLSTEQGLLLVGLLFAPVFLSVYIGDHFHKAVQPENVVGDILDRAVWHSGSHIHLLGHHRCR